MSEEQPRPDASVGDVADLLGISARGVYRLADTGEIPSYRVGRLLRFDVGEVLAATRTAKPNEVPA